MDLLKISDFCRKYKLPPHRFTRYKRLFHTQKVDGYVKPWVQIDQWNIDMVADIMQHTGTRRHKDRLTLEAFCTKYGLTTEHFNKVCHRMHLEDQNGQMMVVDCKPNYALLKHGRLIRKKT
jgi:hypothetical protein